MRVNLLFVFFVLFWIPSFSQKPPTVPENIYGIKNPIPEGGKPCTGCLTILESMPADVKFGIQLDGDDIYFIMSDIRYFDKLFSKSSDGIAVDIISREQFSCKLKTNRVAKSWAYMGFLLEPVYLKEMKKTALVSETGEIFIKMGVIPPHLKNDELEFNLLLINNKYLCRYNNFFDIPGQKWGLLEMGLFMDTIQTKAPQGEKAKPGQNVSMIFSKKMRFEIPFEKNKYEYSSADIKPLYDSLRLNNYDIKNISIRAFSSIEGPTEKNIQLQEKRAQSIIKVLQSFQLDTIHAEVTASENWVEFLEDIEGTKFSNLKSLSKAEIKERLENKQLSTELEPILKNHRKAILLIELEKKSKFSENDTNKIKQAFEKSIQEKNLAEAMEIQQIIFSRIRQHKIPYEFLANLEIPETYDYGSLLNNYAVFNYEHSEADVVSALKNFEKLQLLLPNSKNIKYNIVALKIKSWVYGQLIAEPEQLRKEIAELEKLGFDKRLIRRMQINFHIILSEYQMLKKNYAEKDKSVKYIQTNYSTLNLNDVDALNLARYFVGYSKYEWAESILNRYVTKVDVNEDLLFYYLNLTIIRPKMTASNQYRAIMLNAININKERFCKLFYPFGAGGITFQLLQNEYLKKTYCENCQ
jgi:ribosomal protein S20